MGELSRDRTCWVFVSDSNEPRHLFDIISAVDVLRTRGVPSTNVLVFTDFSEAGLHLGPYGIPCVGIAELSSTLLGVRDCDGIVLVATGHGLIQGIGAAQPVLTPHQVLEAVRAVPGLKTGVIVVCQCYAGVFDMLDVAAAPPLIMIGAVRLNPSLSASFQRPAAVKQQDESDGLRAWAANIFMAAFFAWIAQPLDVDGDGKLSVADAYKYAGARSNQSLISIKSRLFIAVRSLAAEIELGTRTIQAKYQSGQSPDPADVLSLLAKNQELQQSLETLHNHQEAWLLHAKQARDTVFIF